MYTKKTSPIWTIDKKEFKKICKKSNSLAEILRQFNLHEGAGNYKTLKKRIEEENIDISHIPKGRGHNKNRHFGNKLPYEDWAKLRLIIKKNYSGNFSIKKRLIEEGILKNICAICSLGDEWNGKKIIHIMDHINGNSKDNRIENLRIVCPNCNSQLDTFCSKNIKLKENKNVS